MVTQLYCELHDDHAIHVNINRRMLKNYYYVYTFTNADRSNPISKPNYGLELLELPNRLQFFFCTALDYKAIAYFSFTIIPSVDRSIPPAATFGRMTMSNMRFDSKLRSALRHHAMQAWRSASRNATAQINFFDEIVLTFLSFNKCLLLSTWIGR